MSEDHNAPSFPPLLHGENAGASDPFELAIVEAKKGTDPGLVTYNLEPERLRAAIVFTPESALEDSMAMVFVASIGFADALGALAPPEVGVHFEWPGILRLNGAKCGEVYAAASTNDPTAEPDWLVVGLSLQIFPKTTDVEPGDTPEFTSLIEEGCSDIPPTRLLESWTRHTLVWVNRFMEDGMAPIYADWCARAHGMDEDILVEGKSGKFVGIDEKGGLLLQSNRNTDLIPLSKILEAV